MDSNLLAVEVIAVGVIIVVGICLSLYNHHRRLSRIEREIDWDHDE